MRAEREVFSSIDLVVVVVLQKVILHKLIAHPRIDELAILGHEEGAAPQRLRIKLAVVVGCAKRVTTHPTVLQTVRETTVRVGDLIALLKLVGDVAKVIKGVGA